MRLLLISDEESPRFWDNYRPGCLDGIDLILSAGDLKPAYLRFLVTMGRAPLLYIHGNHDARYAFDPPEGCECIDGKLVKFRGLRILGLDGCPDYNHGPYQYSERRMRRRLRRLWLPLHLSKGVDLVLTHAPARGYGDLDDPAHRGFQCFLDLLDAWHPRYLIHGHVHPRYQMGKNPVLKYGDTTILNACGYRILEIPDP